MSQNLVRRLRINGAILFASALMAIATAGLLLSTSAMAQKLVVEPVAETKLTQLPPGPLYWSIETFPDLALAKAAAGPTGLAAEVAGKVWLFTLGPKGRSTAGASKVAEIGPVPPFTAPEYLLRVNRAGGPPGAKTPVHTHPGTEAFLVLAGRMSQRTPHGIIELDAGQSAPGHGPDVPMEVSSSGTSDLNQLVLFLVDATRPFSTPASLD
jgi:hypothetical protein